MTKRTVWDWITLWFALADAGLCVAAGFWQIYCDDLVGGGLYFLIAACLNLYVLRLLMASQRP